jgi:hypothetical protein
MQVSHSISRKFGMEKTCFAYKVLCTRHIVKVYIEEGGVFPWCTIIIFTRSKNPITNFWT